MTPLSKLSDVVAEIGISETLELLAEVCETYETTAIATKDYTLANSWNEACLECLESKSYSARHSGLPFKTE